MGFPEQINMPSSIFHVEGAVLTGAQPDRSFPLKAGLKPASAASSAEHGDGCRPCSVRITSERAKHRGNTEQNRRGIAQSLLRGVEPGERHHVNLEVTSVPPPGQEPNVNGQSCWRDSCKHPCRQSRRLLCRSGTCGQWLVRPGSMPQVG